MTDCVALLRGINVGKAKRVAMARPIPLAPPKGRSSCATCMMVPLMVTLPELVAEQPDAVGGGHHDCAPGGEGVHGGAERGELRHQ